MSAASDEELEELCAAVFRLYDRTLREECSVTDWTPSYADSDLLDRAHKAIRALRDERRELRAALERIGKINQWCGGNLTFEEMALYAMREANRAITAEEPPDADR